MLTGHRAVLEVSSALDSRWLVFHEFVRHAQTNERLRQFTGLVA
jgi:hypothetical protein